jgi:hypothetical protein
MKPQKKAIPTQITLIKEGSWRGISIKCPEMRDLII